MATLKDYTTGKIVKNAILTHNCIKFVKIPVIGPLIKREIVKKMKTFESRLIDQKTASKLIYKSNKCAVGERACRAAHKDSKYTESVFLDDLAIGMVNTGKAKYLTPEEAVKAIAKYPKNPLILSKVSGKYMEICRSEPGTCICWEMNKKIPEFILKKF